MLPATGNDCCVPGENWKALVWEMRYTEKYNEDDRYWWVREGRAPYHLRYMCRSPALLTHIEGGQDSWPPMDLNGSCGLL